MPRKGESIYHRKDGLWEARYVKSIDISGRKKYASVYAHSYCEVKLKRREAVDNLRLCQISPTTRGKTVSAAVEEWLAVNNERLRLSTRQK